MKKFIIGILLACCSATTYAWNAMGHELVAQIAFDNLSDKAKKMCQLFLRARSNSVDKDFIKSATWLDKLKQKDVHWFDTLHYIDIPYTVDETSLPPIQDANALWGIKQATTVLLSSKASLKDKNLSLKILIHLVGDIHQPLHTVTRISKRLPQGDLGGNLYSLTKTPIGQNLHQYWDNGAGVLLGQTQLFQIRNKATQLEHKWSCSIAKDQINPQKWVNEAHKLALTQVYSTPAYRTPGKRYQLNVQSISQRQILLAGCRLANVLNMIAEKLPIS
jgi:hypothetical protein